MPGLRHTARSHVVCDRPRVVCARPLAVRSVHPFVPCSPVSLPRACPFLCSPCPPVAVYLCAVHASLSHAVRAHLFLRSPSPFISALPVPVGLRTARRLSTCFRCRGFRSGGSGMTVAASTCRPKVYIYRCGRNRCRNRRRIGSPIGEDRGAADRRLRGVSFPNGRSFLPETIFLR